MSTGTAAAGGDLSKLLETEARLDELLRRAREEAGALVEQARRTAAERETALDVDLSAAAARLEAEIAAERERREREIVEQARREAAAFDAIPAERVEELARYLVGRVIGEGGSGE